MSDFIDKTFSEKLRTRIGNTWASILSCQEGSPTVSDGSPAASVEDSAKSARVVLMKEHGIVERHKILEIGSGGGGLIKTMQQAGFADVTGITLGQGNIDNAKNSYGIDLLRMDMHFTSFPNCTFDSVIGFHIFEHTPSALLAGLEMFRILKPSGKLLIEVPGGEASFGYDYNAHHLNAMEDWQLKNTLRKCGFINVSVKVVAETASDGIANKLLVAYAERGNTNKDISPHLKDVANGKWV